MKQRKHLFEPFYTTKKDIGTGLGLWVTRGIVEKHGGMIHVRSKVCAEQHGTAFSIFLPENSKVQRDEAQSAVLSCNSVEQGPDA